MAINFPDSPSNGDTHVVGGVTYAYNSTKNAWETIGGAITTTGSGDTPPANPTDGDLWFNSSSAELSVRYNDGTSSQWVVVSGVAGPPGTPGTDGSSPNLSAVAEDILPDADSSRSLGSASKKWKDLFLSGDTISLGGIKLKDAGGSLKVETSAGADVSPGGTKIYANLAAFPASGNAAGDIGFATDTKASYMWDGVVWQRISIGSQIGPRYTTTPSGSHTLTQDGTASTITAVAVDESGFPVTYNWDAFSGSTIYNDDSLPPQLASITKSNGVFTLTPSTNTANAGNFSFRVKASDGVLSTPAISTVSLTFYTFVKPTVYASAGNGSTIGASIASQTATSITFNMNTVGGSYASARSQMAGLELPYGKYYFEAVTTNNIDYDMFALTTYDWATQPSFTDGNANSYGWIYNKDPTAYQYKYTNDIGTTSSSGGAYDAFWSVGTNSSHANSTDRAGIAYDSATNNWWMRLGQSGWMWGDPVAGTGGYNGSTAGVSNGTSHKFFLGTGSGSAGNYSFRVESQSLHQYSTPTGFTTL